MNNIKNFEKASKIVAKIQNIDLQLEAIKKLAGQIANNEVNVSQTLRVNLIKKKEEEVIEAHCETSQDVAKKIFDQMMKTARPVFHQGSVVGVTGAMPEPVKDMSAIFENRLSDAVALKILAVISDDINSDRKNLKAKFDKLDFSKLKI